MNPEKENNMHPEHLYGQIPIGCILPYAGMLARSDFQSWQSPPDPNNPDKNAVYYHLARAGWLYCDGHAYACAEYPLLFRIIGYIYGGKDKQFCVPDLRGRFLRGVDDHSGRDPAAQQRRNGDQSIRGDRVGSLQQDAFQGHEHYYQCVELSLPAQPGGPNTYATPTQSRATEGICADQSAHDTPRIDKETRPINIAINYIIRYR